MRWPLAILRTGIPRTLTPAFEFKYVHFPTWLTNRGETAICAFFLFLNRSQIDLWSFYCLEQYIGILVCNLSKDEKKISKNDQVTEAISCNYRMLRSLVFFFVRTPSAAFHRQNLFASLRASSRSTTTTREFNFWIYPVSSRALRTAGAGVER